MKNAKHLLNLYFLIVLSGCAEASVLKATIVPERPQSAICIGGDAGAQCFDKRVNPQKYAIPSLKNYVCMPAQENQAQEEWIKILKGAVSP